MQGIAGLKKQTRRNGGFCFIGVAQRYF